ncbi:cupin domain-containing protein [Streptomyces sp. ISL-11]|uniref:cupin domain-containing protein n=1 Tax=Streptomyces sp. ISL-11 TaxID=2819174 RepID=UPI001BECE46E|nr:cupin domain-containing protein [Streptomyces sp. ISL-11]MBT2384897.1 cupin domain-containing protein [Streptomyces sp. ISL-11]
METINVVDVAQGLGAAWKSQVLGDLGGTRVKALRMDGAEGEEEVHGDAEALFVVEGALELDLDGTRLTVGPGELCLVPPRTPHAVRAGSHGVLIIVER